MSPPVHDRAFFIQRVRFVDLIAIALDVPVQIGDVVRDDRAASVVPRPLADAVACVHGRLTTRGRLTEIRAPRPSGRCLQSSGLSHLRAVGIGAGNAAVVGAVTLADARDEERRWAGRASSTTATATLCRRARGRLLRRLGERHQRPERGDGDHRQNVLHPAHLVSSHS
jgi:hypothetical protein